MRLFACACCGGRGPVFAADVGGSGAASPPASRGPVAREALQTLAQASRILAQRGVFDAFGHISMRHPTAPDRFLMPRSISPALVEADDIMEFDLDATPCDQRDRGVFYERFIHGQIYRARPDVMSVVHSHSLSVIPFSVVETPMRAMYHNAAFIAAGVPVFDIAEKFGPTDMLVGDNAKGAELARVLADKAVVLMRGHGSVAVGPSVETAAFRAIMTENNARLQLAAIQLGGPIHALDVTEGALADELNLKVVQRPWQLWTRQLGS